MTIRIYLCQLAELDIDQIVKLINLFKLRLKNLN